MQAMNILKKTKLYRSQVARPDLLSDWQEKDSGLNATVYPHLFFAFFNWA